MEYRAVVCKSQSAPCVTIRQFFSVVMPRKCDGWLIMVQANLDDTGGDGFVGFGGFAGKEEAWARALEPAWEAENERHGIAEFHGNVYPNLVETYAALALEYDIRLVGYTIDRQAYREYTSKRKRHPFGLNEWASSAAGCAHRIFDW